MRVVYRRVRGREAMFAVWLADDVRWLAGFVHEADGRWIARRRGDTTDKFSPGWDTRTEAAEWLLLTGGFAQRPVRMAA